MATSNPAARPQMGGQVQNQQQPSPSLQQAQAQANHLVSEALVPAPTLQPHQQLVNVDSPFNNFRRGGGVSFSPPSSDVESTQERNAASFELSTRMFENARNVNISGGEWYNTAGGVSIGKNFPVVLCQFSNSILKDASHGTVSRTLSTNVTHLWHYQQVCNQVALSTNIGERIDCGSLESKRGDDLSTFGEDDEREATEKRQNSSLSWPYLETESLDPHVGYLHGRDKSGLEKDQQQVFQDGIDISSSSPSSEELLIDEVIYHVLSNYPPPPIGDLRSFQRIVQALLFSFSPLSSPTLAALLGLKDARHVEQVLLPASALIFIPRSEDNKEGENDPTPIQFTEPSIVDFFLDRTRSGRYYVDGPRAHSVLLDVCTLVMEEVNGRRLDMVDWWWRDAYEYACQNWERHRRAGTRAKL